MTVRLAIDERRPDAEGGTLDLAPAAVLPAQLAPAFQLDAGVHPEKRLMLAVLEEAVAAYQKFACATSAPSRREFLEAQTWLENNGRHWPYSFLNVCETLGLAPDAIRSGLHRWRDRQRTLPETQRVRIRHPFRRTNGSRTRTRGRAPGVRLVD